MLNELKEELKNIYDYYPRAVQALGCVIVLTIIIELI